MLDSQTRAPSFVFVVMPQAHLDEIAALSEFGRRSEPEAPSSDTSGGLMRLASRFGFVVKPPIQEGVTSYGTDDAQFIIDQTDVDSVDLLVFETDAGGEDLLLAA